MTVREFLDKVNRVRRGGKGWTAQCPSHEDRINSLSVAEGNGGRVLLKCHAGCTVEEIVRALGLTLSDLFPSGQVEDRRMKGRKRPPLSVEELAHDKALPTDFLVRLGLRNIPSGVRIPYRLADGTLAPRQRIRTALTAKRGSFWTKGVGVTVPYGLWRLEEARRAGFIVLVEGESDCWTLWFHHLPSLGLPGADTAGKIETAYLTGINHVYVIREPGDGGSTFVAGVAERLHEIRWKGDARCVALQGAKDPNDLHKQNPDGFKQAFQQALHKAEALPQPQPEPTNAQAPGPSIPYMETEDGLYWMKPTSNGEVPIPLINFTARIVADIEEDDGTEVRHALEIEAVLKNRVHHFSVSGGQFAGMNWVLDQLGAGAIIFPGSTIRDHARVALQLLSGDVPKRTVFKHLGWRKVGEEWVYLHAAGAIGANASVPEIQVSVPDSLSRFILPEPPTGDALICAIRASLRLLDVAPLQVTAPVYAAIWRALLGQADFSAHLAGQTGFGKTELATLLQQHFGAAMDSRNLPGSWESTANALEALAFYAKDALLVIDDFAPIGNGLDIQRSHRDADRVLRAQGNNSGRQRLGADATMKPSKPPRGLIVSTGEDVPKGKSLRARVLIDELGPADIDWHTLTLLQEDAAKGLYAQASAAFVRWLAPRYEGVHRILRGQVAKLRQNALASGWHKRTPDILASLGTGLRYWFDFAVEAGALTFLEADAIWQRCWNALGVVAAAQAKHQAASDPVTRFLELLNSAITSGRAHCASEEGSQPEQPAAWGWRETPVGGNGERTERRPQGSRVGWVTRDGLFLDPDAALVAAQGVGHELGEAIALTAKTLHKRLHERGLLQAVDQSRETLTVRRTLEGRRRDVLHLRRDMLLLEVEPSRLETKPGESSGSGTIN